MKYPVANPNERRTPIRFMDDIVWIKGGESFVGTDNPLLEEDGEGPRRRVLLKPFGVCKFVTTNRQFSQFVDETGYVTLAERLKTSFVFFGHLPRSEWEKHPGPVEIPWWRFVHGACWKHPLGPNSNIEGKEDHPVVHVARSDAQAFAKWAGGRLLSEAEWEFSASGGRDVPYPWGTQDFDDNSIPCKIWRGEFPVIKDAERESFGTVPVSQFEPNSFGIWNLCGNVWEWTNDRYRVRSPKLSAKKRNKLATARKEFVLKGGSYLCHKSYCYRYRVHARLASSLDSTTTHIGFRVGFDPVNSS